MSSIVLLIHRRWGEPKRPQETKRRETGCHLGISRVPATVPALVEATVMVVPIFVNTWSYRCNYRDRYRHRFGTWELYSYN